MTDDEGVAWSKTACIALVKGYQRHGELWDKTHQLYRVRRAKFKAWTALAEKMSCRIQDIKKKLESIMASYRSQRSKVKDGGSSFWFLYPYLSFLPGYVQMPNQYEYVTPDSPKSDAPTYASGTEDDEHDKVRIKVEREPGQTKKLNNDKGRLSRTLKRKMVVRKYSRNTNLNKTYIDKKILEVKHLILKGTSPSVKDDCDSFGEYIASTLKKYDNKTQCLIKRSINNILYEQEMAKYDYLIVGSNSEETAPDPAVKIPENPQYGVVHWNPENLVLKAISEA